MIYNFTETIEINENVYPETLFVPRYVNRYLNKGHYYDDDVNKRMRLKEYNIGDTFEPFDNSFCIDLETGKREWIAGTCIGNPFKYHEFVIVDGPYWDHIKFGTHDNEPASVLRFVTVKDTSTNKYYRVLCKEYNF